MGKRYLFSNKRQGLWNGKWFYIALICICIFGFWMIKNDNLSDVSSFREVSQKEDINANAQIFNDQLKKDKKDYDNVLNKKEMAYYLLKEADGQIKLYHYDENGNEQVLKITDIPFNLISEADQEYFKNGVIIKDENKLNELLQDFES